MAKLGDFLSEILAPVFKKKEDLDLFVAASALREIEIPDEVRADFNAKYLTRERAFTDDEIVKKFNLDARGRVFSSIDLKIKDLLPKISKEDQDAINAEPNTLLKMELLNKAMDNLGKGDDVKKLNEAFRKKESEYHEKLSAYEEQIKQKDSTFGKQIKEVKLDYALRSKVAGFDLAPEFSSDKHKSFLADSTINTLKKNFVLEFDEKDESIIHVRKDTDGVITDVFEGNNKVTLADVLTKEYEPYIKKSNSAGHTPPPAPGVKAQTIPTDKPLTLRDKMLAAEAAKS